MRYLTIASLAAMSSALALPQVKEANASDPWAEYDYLAANVQTLVPPIFEMAAPGSMD
jgi:hypothetical protein